MKTKRDPRHLARIKIVQELFEDIFRTNSKLTPKVNYAPQTTQILKHQKAINQIISRHAPAWPIEQIAPIDLAILKLAIWELLYERKNPVKVVIDEAVEIAKSYGSDTSSAFINGVLGSIVTEKKLQ